MDALIRSISFAESAARRLRSRRRPLPRTTVSESALENAARDGLDHSRAHAQRAAMAGAGHMVASPTMVPPCSAASNAAKASASGGSGGGFSVGPGRCACTEQPAQRRHDDALPVCSARSGRDSELRASTIARVLDQGAAPVRTTPRLGASTGIGSTSASVARCSVRRAMSAPQAPRFAAMDAVNGKIRAAASARAALNPARSVPIVLGYDR